MRVLSLTQSRTPVERITITQTVVKEERAERAERAERVVPAPREDKGVRALTVPALKAAPAMVVKRATPGEAVKEEPVVREEREARVDGERIFRLHTRRVLLALILNF